MAISKNIINLFVTFLLFGFGLFYYHAYKTCFFFSYILLMFCCYSVEVSVNVLLNNFVWSRRFLLKGQFAFLDMELYSFLKSSIVYTH